MTWTLDPCLDARGFHTIREGDGSESGDTSAQPIATVYAIENAALVAASPAMFAALEIARATIERLDARAKAKSAQGTLDVINAALARATNLEGK